MKKITGRFLKTIIKKATENLLKHKDEINALNVFPVPDGDTGSNMSSTMLEACKYIDNTDSENLTEVWRAIKEGALMGARGNSGVILSQILRGMADASPEDFITPRDVVRMISNARKIAYSAVMRPVEGTMLTVIRELDEKLKNKSFETFEELFDWIVETVKDTVSKTPRMLPKLKEAGVVDAGAKGLYYIFEGMRDAIKGDIEVNLEQVEQASVEELQKMALEEITNQYCTEVAVRRNRVFEKSELEHFLNEIGDSVVLVEQDDLFRLHVHTNHPGQVLEKVLEFGEIVKVKIDNMKLQHEHIISAQIEKEVGVVAVSPGRGISEILKGLGVDVVVPGGQTMNPSFADLKTAVEQTHAKVVFLFPNNANVLLTAKQVAETIDDREVIVIPTSYVQECVAAMIEYDPDEEPSDLVKRFEEAINQCVPISITKAVRDSKYGRKRIKKGEYLVFVKKELAAHGFDLTKALKAVLEKENAREKEILTVFLGDNYRKSELESIQKLIGEEFPNLDLEIHEGEQPHYPFLILLQ
ncbi:DAK2 domain-containing protein [Thermotoga sp. KOL6]|uniref:DAK2 domain-containing protein n=1 Tax=Thermotoga sp. KOL6 TaxID=126741 RepID=UPI000C77C7AB|nr:DAK2 domain-containing protein [Thermotoga sp. KOL6]PLV60147.1 DAK2 domain fusion protein YloV [Thermotoga sp. KOL6]